MNSDGARQCAYNRTTLVCISEMDVSLLSVTFVSPVSFHDGNPHVAGGYPYRCAVGRKIIGRNVRNVASRKCKSTLPLRLTNPTCNKRRNYLRTCLGMWRFGKVYASHCPNLPNRLSGRSSVQDDTIRAKHFDSTDVATGFAGWTRGAFEGWYTSRLQAVVAA